MAAGDEHALATAIWQLSENPTQCQQLARAARETVRSRFLIEANAKLVEQHLQRAIHHASSSSGESVLA